MGDVVNVAARIMGHAASVGGGVFCDAPTRDFLAAHPPAELAAAGLQYGEERGVAVKGKLLPIAITPLAYAEGGAGAAPGPRERGCGCCGGGGGGGGGGEHLVDRQKEMAALDALAADYAGGRHDSVLAVVEGRQGMGKVRAGTLLQGGGRFPK